MGDYTQDNRPLKITTPLGEGALFIVGISGQEAISQLFSFRLELVAPNDQTIDFDKLLGASITVESTSPSLDGSGPSRYFNGICSRVGAGEREEEWTNYWMEIVPKPWLLSRVARSRTFQQKNVPDIINAVLTGYDFQLRLTGTYKPRDYCVQYRETDFNFLSRLMEEEGIYYYFKHTDGAHTLNICDAPTAHDPIDGAATINHTMQQGDSAGAGVVTSWTKTQELRSGKYTLRDYHFEMNSDNFEASKPILASVAAGQTTHKLKIAGVNDSLELYDFPGEYAQRFDGTAPGGGDRAADLSNIADDKTRTVEIRIREEASMSLLIQGESNVQAFQAGRKFTLGGHYDGDGDYVLTSVKHSARLEGGFSNSGGGLSYSSSFTCIPYALPFAPKRVTPKPVIHGTQSAVVVGPSGNEIFTDKYGRVKAQFHWDRDGQNNADSSCWMRVGTLWAGKQWGMIHIPRIGQEVIVAFEEGDPDQPIIVGSVFNAANMPPYTLPDNKTQSGIKTRSSLQGDAAMFNELRFEDKKDSEDIYFHAQKDFHRVVENDDDLKVGHDQTIEIKNARTETVKEGDETVTIEQGKRLITVKTGDDEHMIETGNHLVTVKTGNDTHNINTGNREVTIKTGNDTLNIDTGNRTTTLKTGNDALTLNTGNMDIHLKVGNLTIKLDVGKITLDAMQGIDLVVGQSKVSLSQQGIQMGGMQVAIQGQVQTEVKGMMTTVSADAMLQAKGSITMIG